MFGCESNCRSRQLRRATVRRFLCLGMLGSLAAGGTPWLGSDLSSPLFAQSPGQEAPSQPATTEPAATEQPPADATATATEATSVEPAPQATSSPSDNTADEVVSALQETSTLPLSDRELDQRVQLRMSFNGTPWKEVLEWFSEETGMSLQRDTWPTGTFTYADPRNAYSISQAIDAMNLVLMREGYSLIRRGQLLMLIDLEENLARDYLREWAEPIRPEDLDTRANSDFVRVAFPIGTLDPQDVVDDLEKLRSPSGSIQVLTSSRVVLATDTVGVLKSIRDVLLASDATDGGVVEYQLRYRPAEDILEIARPHLGLEAGENTGEDISVSTNFLGDRIFATGDPVKLRILKGLIEKCDRALPTAEGQEDASLEAPYLHTYFSGSADPTVAMEVLTRMLAGLPDVRMTMDPKTNAIILQARKAEHELAVRTLDELNGKSQSFKVIQLRRIDPQAALLTINKYFGKTAENQVGPTVDGDPETKKLWIKGTETEIAEVERLIQELEGGSNSGFLDDRIRILPYTGRSAEQALSQLESLWQMSGRNNRIRIMSSQDLRGRGGNIPERRLNQSPSEAEGEDTQPMPRQFRIIPRSQPQPEAATPAGDAEASLLVPRPLVSEPDGSDAFAYHFVNLWQDGQAESDTQTASDPADAQAGTTSQGSEQPAPTEATTAATTSQPPAGTAPAGSQPAGSATTKPPSDIIIQLTPQGIIVASDDTEALNDFEALMASLSDQMAASDDQPTVYWLKYIKADVAAEMLNSVLSGSSSGGDMGGGLLNEIGGGMLGGLMGFGGGGGGGDSGPVLTTTGTVAIVPDSRLNALIIQANSTDLGLVEDILQVIDREESPEDVSTSPRPQLIPVIYQDANEVANIVKSLYSDRMAGQAGGQSRQPSPEDFINALRGRGGRGGNNRSENNKPTPINIAVDARSNSLIVSAPPQDFLDIRELVEVIDQEGMETQQEMVVHTMKGNINSDALSNAISAFFGAKATTGGATANGSGSNSSSSSGSNAPSANDIQQRMDMFRRIQEMRSRGGSGGRPSFGGGGSPFGGRSSGGRPSFGGRGR